MPFKKGNRANPGGRPKVDESVSKLLRDALPGALRRIMEIANGNDNKLALDASKYLVDRNLGKPAQAVEVGGVGGGAIEVSVFISEKQK